MKCHAKNDISELQLKAICTWTNNKNESADALCKCASISVSTFLFKKLNKIILDELF